MWIQGVNYSLVSTRVPWTDGTVPRWLMQLSPYPECFQNIQGENGWASKYPLKTKLHSVACSFAFSLQSLHLRQGWECSNCSEVTIWFLNFIYLGTNQHHHCSGTPHWSLSWGHHGRRVHLCNFPPVTQLPPASLWLISLLWSGDLSVFIDVH